MDTIEIMRGNGVINDYGIDIVDKKSDNILAVIHKKQSGRTIKKYAVLNKNSQTTAFKIPSNDFYIEAVLPHKKVINGEKSRVTGLITGGAGTGKGLAIKMLVPQYIAMYNQPVYYICMTDMKDDISVRDLNMTQLDIDSVVDNNVEDFADSLVVFDDIDKADNHKELVRLIDKIVKLGRKFGVSLIYSSHLKTHAKETTVNEGLDFYVTNNKALHNNRALSLYLNIDKNALDSVGEFNNAYIFVNVFSGYIVTDKIIMKY